MFSLNEGNRYIVCLQGVDSRNFVLRSVFHIKQ